TLGNVVSGDFYEWEVGIKLEYPLGNRSAKSRATVARLDVQQQILDTKDLEKKIILEVREAVRQTKTDTKRVNAARIARKFAEEKLKAEEKKFEVGLSTSFKVLEFQEDLAEEQSNEIQAIIDYNKSIIKLQQVLATILEENNIRLFSQADQ
ncbi:MAG: TolC family protein, partial [Nitrospinales bacterium]